MRYKLRVAKISYITLGKKRLQSLQYVFWYFLTLLCWHFSVVENENGCLNSVSFVLMFDVKFEMFIILNSAKEILLDELLHLGIWGFGL